MKINIAEAITIILIALFFGWWYLSTVGKVRH